MKTLLWLDRHFDKLIHLAFAAGETALGWAESLLWYRSQALPHRPDPPQMGLGGAELRQKGTVAGALPPSSVRSGAIVERAVVSDVSLHDDQREAERR